MFDFENIFKAYDNRNQALRATIQFCRLLSVRATSSTISKRLRDHPNFPSLFSIDSVLHYLGMESVVLKNQTSTKLKVYDRPCIVQLKYNDFDYFSVVRTMDDNKLKIFDPIKNKWTFYKNAEFDKYFTGIALLAEKEEQQNKKDDYWRQVINEYMQKGFVLLAMLLLPILFIINSIVSFHENGYSAIPYIAYAFLFLCGIVISFIIFLSEDDHLLSLTHKLCPTSKTVDCDRILKSRGAHILGISWAVLGLSYFTGGLVSLLIIGFKQSAITSLLGLISIVASTYMFFSIYYQWKVIKKWCLLCLITQVILLLQLIICISTGIIDFPSLQKFSFNGIIVILLSYLTPFVVFLIIEQFLSQLSKKTEEVKLLRNVKYDPIVFQTFLSKQKTISFSADGLGITLGNPKAKNKLIKVCNPYCHPCSLSHRDIMELLNLNYMILQVQIIYSASGNMDDLRTPPVAHLLAISEKGNELITRQALDDWYLNDKKEYGAFALKYPMNGELKLQTSKIVLMSEWCSQMQIAYTPTYFFNGYELPHNYKLEELRYILK